MIQEEQEQHLLFKDILKSLEKYNGKEISKRLETYLKKEFPAYHIRMETHPVMTSKLYVSKDHREILNFNFENNRDGILDTEKLYQCSYGIYSEKRLALFNQNKEFELPILEQENEELIQLKAEYKKRISEIKKKSLENLGYTYYFEE
jgi:hypothetical protein